MKHDPLLSTWAPPVADQATEMPALVSRTRTPQQREKHPAISSRILATGFSIAAVIGVSTAYAKAQKAEELQKLIDAQNAAQAQAENGTDPSVAAQSSNNALPPAVPQNSAPSVQAPATTVAPQTTAPSIVQVPVQPAQPAQPAYTPPAQNRGNQSSGGSR